jgi:hypothetical protein
MTIHVTQSPSADTRTCDFANVSRETLLTSSVVHIRDVARALEFFAAKLRAAAIDHDEDKVSGIEWFHADFITGFAQTGWWDNHRRITRHHLAQADGVPDDVNLLDVLEYVADCVMAGMARSGSVRPLEVSDDLLRRAFENTARLLTSEVSVHVEAPTNTREALERAIELIAEDEERVTFHAAEGEEEQAAAYSRRAKADIVTLRTLLDHA